MLRAGLRGMLTMAALVALYYLLPMDRVLDAVAITWLVLGLVIFMVLAGWQVRAILRADHPALRAFNALATAIPLFLLMFASTYFLMAQAQADAFTESLNRTDALYFTITVFATVGFGDITPQSEIARIVTTAQMVVNLLVFGVLVRVVVGAVRSRRAVSATAQAASPPPPVTMRAPSSDDA
jgi:voltage-gated potassium channel